MKNIEVKNKSINFEVNDEIYNKIRRILINEGVNFTIEETKNLNLNSLFKGDFEYEK